jgi:hypothetical protein
METMRTALERGDRAAARDRRGAVERRSKMLIDQDKEFEKGLKSLLSKDQTEAVPDAETKPRKGCAGPQAA